MSVANSLNIDDSILKTLEKADESMKKLAQTASNTSAQIIKSFQDISTLGVGQFIGKVRDAETALNSLNNKKINPFNMGGVSDASKIIDVINKMLSAYERLNGETKKTTTQKAGLFGGMGSSVKEWEKIQVQIQKNNEQIQRLTQSTKEYELLQSRLQSGKSVVIQAGASKEYQDNLKQIEVLREQNALLDKKQRAIVETNKALSAQANMQQSLKQFNSDQTSLPEQRKNEELKKMNDYYRNLERSSKKAAQTSADEMEKAAKREAAAIDKIMRQRSKLYQQQNIKKNTTFQGALDFSADANTINRRVTAIKYLEAARNQLSKTDSQYEVKVAALNREISRQTREVERLKGKSDSLRNSHYNLINTSAQLQRSIALLFSVSQITGYMNKLINVRKEFELQQKSLEVLLQSKSQADKLWQQTLDLAVKSPFRVKELVTYTKQLAAYRIETDKLHDTTIRLSDVSAGLGVDMQRLILAYGQVRSANFLRGTELRQFTEAGIPMLDELAKYLTDIEGVSVSVGEVFERISKRMISFEDVTAVFHRMTDAGGAFYKMQEEQSKTLAGMISNLHDSIDLMLNEIGKSNEGIIKGTLNITRAIVDNWQTTADIIKSIAAAFALYKLNMLLASNSLKLVAIDMGILTSTVPKQLSVLQLLNIGWIKLRKTIIATGKSIATFVSTNPLIAFSALAAFTLGKLVFTLMEHEEALDNITDAYVGLRQKLETIKFDFNTVKSENDIKALRSKLTDLIAVADRDYGINIKVNMEELDATQIVDKFNEISQTLFDVNLFTEGFLKAYQRATEWTIEDDVFEDLKELGSTAADVFEKAYNKRIQLVNRLRESEEALTDTEKKALVMLSKQKKEFGTEEEFLQNLIDGYDLLSNSLGGYYGIFKKFGVSVGNIDRDFTELKKNIREAKDEYVSVLKTINLEGLTDEEKTIKLTTAINTLASQNNWNNFVVDYLYKWTEEEIKVPIGFKIDENEKDLLEWQNLYNENFKGFEGFKKIEVSATKQNDIVERLKENLKVTEELYERMKKAEDGAYSNYDLESVATKVKQLNQQLAFFGVAQKNKGKDWFSEVIKSVKDAHSEFVKLNKTLDKTESKQIALERFKDVFATAAKNAKLNNISLGQFTFETESGVVEAFSFLKDKLPKNAKEARFKLEEAIGEIRGEVRIRTKAEDDKLLIEQIEDMFSGYEMSIELQKMNIPPDLAKQLFNIDSLTLPDLRDKIKSMESKFIGTDMEEEYRKFLKKIDEMEAKEQEERLKKYVTYLTKASSERVKIKIEELRQIAELEKEDAFNEGQKETIKRAIRVETQEKLDKQSWEDFKNSGLYTQMFEDLEHIGIKSVERLKERLISLKGSLKDLPASDLKEIMTQINKLEDIEIEYNPFKSLRESLKEINALKEQGLNRDIIEQNINVSQGKIDNYNKEIEAIQTIQQMEAKGLDSEEYRNIMSKDYLYLISATNDELNDKLSKLQDNVNLENKNLKTAQGQLASWSKAEKAALKAIDNTEAWGEAIKNTLGGIDSLLDAFGVAEDDSSRMWLKNIEAIAQMIVQTVVLTLMMKNLEIASNSALGVIGWIAMALSAVATIFSSIFQAGDKRKEQAIQRELDLVEKLERQYKKLEKAIDDAYSIHNLEKDAASARQNVQAQIRSYYAMIEAEEDKKKIDDDRIKEWRGTIEDLQDQLSDLNKDVVSSATGGIMDSVMDASREFTDAWLEAFRETGDGLSGLESNFKETMLEMVKQQASMLISHAYVDKWKKQLEQYINPYDLELSTDEAKKWVDAVTTSLPQLNQALENYFTAMQQAGVDLGSDTSSQLSGLQRGIQEIQESTAQEIAAYLNSIRFFVSQNNEYLRIIAQSYSDTEMQNPMLSELRSQTELIRSIRDMFSSVIRGGHPTYGGAFLKVSL